LDAKKELQSAFIKAYTKSYGNVAKSCKAVDISRGTYYNWLKNDSKFKELVDNCSPEDDFLDFLEDKAVQRINEGSDSVLIFALKSKGKKRGWVEKQIVENQGEPEKQEIDYSKLTEDEIREFIKLKRKLAGGDTDSASGTSET